MPGATSEYGIPYPVGSDPLGDGATAMQELAEGTEAAIIEAVTPTAWASYTPTLAGVTLGNGTKDGRYRRDGDNVYFRIKLVLGSTSVVTGNIQLGLPATVAAAISTAFEPRGQALLADLSTGDVRQWAAAHANTTSVYIVNDTGGLADASTPWTWADGDVVQIAGWYEAA